MRGTVDNCIGEKAEEERRRPTLETRPAPAQPAGPPGRQTRLAPAHLGDPPGPCPPGARPHPPLRAPTAWLCPLSST